jgi:SAM-dependent methyltransferase
VRTISRSILLALVSAACAVTRAQDFGVAVKDVPFLETPDFVVEDMLDLARVTARDVVYDLGSGDGRIVIAAAERGARGVGIEIEPGLVELSRANAERAGVADRVRFDLGDFFETDFGDATVVALYLRRKINAELRPHLERQLAPGTRVVCHRYEIPGWTPAERIKSGGRSIYLYVVR